MTPTGSDPTTGIVSDVSEHLGEVFRYMLPGVLIVASAGVAHPSWFRAVDLRSWHHLLALSVVALAVGNAWFALNRHGLYQLTDYGLYFLRILGPVRTGRSHYLDDLGKFAAKSLHTGRKDRRARKHVALRASSVLLIFTVSELAFVSLWHGGDSVLAGKKCWLIAGGVIAFVIGVWQEAITRRIDYYVVHPPG